MNHSNRALPASIALALVSCAWGTSYAVTKGALETVSPFLLVMFRFGASAVMLGLVYFNRLRRMRRVDVQRGSEIGVFMFLSFLTMVVGLSRTTASKQSFIIGSFVLIVPFFAWIFNKKKPGVREIIGAALALAGLALFTINPHTRFAWGDVISFASAIFFAAHAIMIERYSKDSDPIILTFVQLAVTAALFTVLTGIFESYDFSVLLKIKFSAAYLVVVCTTVPFVVQNIAQRYISSSATALLLTLESVFGSVFAVYFLHETMTAPMIFGCVIIVTAIMLQNINPLFWRRK